MGDTADILKATHDIFNGGDVTVTLDERGLGMAYAIPRGTEDTVIESYGPWHAAELTQVFYKDSSIFQSILAEIQLIMSWRYSDAEQYIVEAYLTSNVISLDPTANVKIQVRFDNPQLYDFALEAYEIPFQIEVYFDPVGSDSTTIYQGIIRADGTGTFDQH